LVLFFKKEQILLFLKKKKQKDFYFWRCFNFCVHAGRRPNTGARHGSRNQDFAQQMSSCTVIPAGAPPGK
jgi:hypothetical protein